jgi:5-methylcytosine-specific restriction endonuclease McrA
MRRMRWDGNLGKALNIKRLEKNRGGAWSRIATLHKACNPRCTRCGSIVDLETDHIKPIHKGGTNEWANLQSLCRACHAIKTRFDLECG